MKTTLALVSVLLILTACSKQEEQPQQVQSIEPEPVVEVVFESEEPLRTYDRIDVHQFETPTEFEEISIREVIPKVLNSEYGLYLMTDCTERKLIDTIVAMKKYETYDWLTGYRDGNYLAIGETCVGFKTDDWERIFAHVVDKPVFIGVPMKWAEKDEAEEAFKIREQWEKDNPDFFGPPRKGFYSSEDSL